MQDLHNQIGIRKMKQKSRSADNESGMCFTCL